MPRDPSGNYTLPALGNPAVTNTPITIAWWNGTSTDLAAAMTDSLSRTGSGGMLGAFGLVDGTAGAPGLTFQSETTTGFYRPTSAEMDWVCGGVRFVRLTAAGFAGSADNGATWKFPLWSGFAGQTVTTGSIDFTYGTLKVGSVSVGATVVTKSSSSGAYTTGSSSYGNVTNLSITFTATGGPVLVQLVPDDSGTAANLSAANTDNSAVQVGGTLALTTDAGATHFAEQFFGSVYPLAGTATSVHPNFPVSSYSTVFSPAAGSTTLTVRAKINPPSAGTTTVAVSRAKLCITQL